MGWAWINPWREARLLRERLAHAAVIIDGKNAALSAYVEANTQLIAEVNHLRGCLMRSPEQRAPNDTAH